MKGFDLKKFEKQHEDNDFATLIHQDGHSLKVAKKSLSHIDRKQIQMMKMAHGGAAGAPVSNQQLSRGNREIQETVAPVFKSLGLDADTREARYAKDLASLPSSPNGEPVAEAVEIEPAAEVLEVEPVKELEIETIPESSVPESQIKQPEPEKNQEAPKESAPIAQEQPKTQAPPNSIPAPSESPLPRSSQQDIIKRYRESDQALHDAYAAGQLKPDKLVSREAASKGNAWLGVLVSALGQVIGAGGVNANLALEGLKRNDLLEMERQKLADNKNFNLWKMNREALGTDIAADLATLNQLNVNNEYKLKKMALETNNAKVIAETNAAVEKMQFDNLKRTRALSIFSDTSDSASIPQKLEMAKTLGYINEAQESKIAEKADEAAAVVKIGPSLFQAFDRAALELDGFKGHIPEVLAGKLPSVEAFDALLGRTLPLIDKTSGQGQLMNLQKSLELKRGLIGSDNKLSMKIKRQALGNYLSSLGEAALAQKVGINFRDYPETNVNIFKNYPNSNEQAQKGSQEEFRYDEKGRKYRLGPNGKAIEVK